MAETPKRHAPKGPVKAKPDPMTAEVGGDVLRRLSMDRMRRLNPTGERCTATSKTSGTQCSKHPIPGGTVCRYHGGNAPQVRAKALERLMAYQNPAIDRLFQLVQQEGFPSTALSAVKDVLDRTMGKPAETVQGPDGGPIEVVFRWQT